MTGELISQEKGDQQEDEDPTEVDLNGNTEDFAHSDGTSHRLCKPGLQNPLSQRSGQSKINSGAGAAEAPVPPDMPSSNDLPLVLRSSFSERGGVCHQFVDQLGRRIGAGRRTLSRA